MRVNVHIEQLVLDGFKFTTDEQTLLQSAFRSEMARLVANPEGDIWLEANRQNNHLSINAHRLAGLSDPIQFGKQLARTVHGGLDL